MTALERQVVPLLGQPFLEIASRVGISADELSSAMGSIMDKFAADPGSPDGTDGAQLFDHLLAEHGVKHEGERPPEQVLLIAHAFEHASRRASLG